MKKLVGCGLLAFIAVMAPLGYSLNDIEADDIGIEQSAGHYEDSGRPFSFYAPYSYQYYYPHLEIGGRR